MDLNPEGFVDAARKIVRNLRYGSRELSIATLGLLLLASPTIFPDEVAQPLKTVLQWIPFLGLLLLASTVWLISRKVIAPVPEGRPKPAAIKGPAPFGPHDAQLFAKLSRNEDLDRLRGWILDDQKPLVALMGESGVGKTSLLRAGLESHLKDDAVQVIYWEALPTDPEAGLLHTVQSHWDNPATAPAIFADLAKALATGKRVVVIDQAEQLSPTRHATVFEMLRQVVTVNPPYTATWVVAFRREYMPVWRDFELTLPDPTQRRLETLSLRRFFPDQAKRVIAVIADESAMPLEQKVVDALIESIQSEGRVTPADIGISLLVLSEISGHGRASSFTIDDFRERGGQAGLLTKYLHGLLEQFSEGERREIFQALLSLINLDNDQRLAEGRTPLELEESARPMSSHRFAAVLRFLASGKARILEEVPEPPLRYRLIHERLIPAIRSLTGVLLAEAEQVGLLLARAYSFWSREPKAKYLLSGRDLRQVLKFRNQLIWGVDADQKREYVRLGVKHRNRLWSLASTLAITIGLITYAYNQYQQKRTTYQTQLESLQLPPDLLDHLYHIENLSIPRGLVRIDWLKEAPQLRSLEIADASLESLAALPQGLRILKFTLAPGSAGSEFPELPVGLISLDVQNLNFTHLKRLPTGLANLTLNDLSMFPLPAQGESTPFSGVIDLSHLENLRSLSIRISHYEAIEKLILPKTLRSLSIDQYEASFQNWRDIPTDLESLRCHCNPEPNVLPSTLKRLALWYPDIVRVTSPPLYSLEIDGSQLGKVRLAGLSSLTIRINEKFNGIELPSDASALKELHLVPDGPPVHLEMMDLPQELTALTISQRLTADFTDKGLPKNLKRLELPEAQTNLPKLPENLTSLTYYGPLQTPLPKHLRSLTINMKDEDLPLLTNLWALNDLQLVGEVTKLPEHLGSLQNLDIRYTQIYTLDGLPPDLVTLTLRPGQVGSLEGLPESVASLIFSW